ncbi:MAG: magnesium/cobalt transporter CorA [Phycisphaerae bacterium]|nr:magnesium/cobalt transporter CorA [Phycisphaerae bacterium]
MLHSKPKRLMPRPNLPPGTLMVEPSARQPTVELMTFGHGTSTERPLKTPESIRSLELVEGQVAWVNIDGLGDLAILEAVAQRFGIHPLAMEDAADTVQRSKIDVYGDHSCIILPMPLLADRHFRTEQLALILGKTWIVTVQEETDGDCLDSLRRRIREHKGRIAGGSASYAAYAMVDAVIDAYFPLIERLEHRIEQLEDDVIFRTSGDDIVRIRHLKRDIATLRRAVWPLRDAVSAMLAADHVFPADDRLYMRDAYDHVTRVLDMLDNARSIAADLTDIYMAVTSNRMGEVTKVLTIIATIFMPLSFLAGLYGMNFDPERSPLNMPELNWYYGYPFALGLMAGTAILLLLFFRRRGWLGTNFLRVQSRRPAAARNRAHARGS